MKNEDVRKFQGKNHFDNMSKDNNFPNGKKCYVWEKRYKKLEERKKWWQSQV